MTVQSPPPIGGAILLRPLLRMVHQLRDAGIPVSSSEVIDATSALNSIDVVDREQVRMAMRATLVKRAEDIPTFELLFELGFAVRSAPAVTSPRDVGAVRQVSTSLDRQSLTESDTEGSVELLERIMDALRRGDVDALRALARMSVDRFGGFEGQPGASERYFMYRVLRALELSKVVGEMLRADASGVGGRSGPLREDLAERIEAFKKLIAGEIRGRLADERGADDANRAIDLFGTEDVDFLGASPRQMAAMREAIRPLARALATKMARRRRRRDRGRLDVRRTVRRSLSSGGVLLEPVFRRPKVARPDLYLLCDVSGSVAEFATFTLTLLQAMTSEFSRMRSFAFIDGIDEVTGHLKDVASFLEVRHVLYRADVVGDDGHSDYGTVFERFWDEHGGSIDSRSTIIITGDARSNYREPRVESLRALHARARKVYLLDPEPSSDWDANDSLVSVYRPMLDGVFEVRNLRQLADAVYRIT